MGTFDVTSEKGGSILFSFYTQNLLEGEKFKLLVDGVVKFQTAKPTSNDSKLMSKKVDA